jgi:hypothetical protein
MKKALVAFAGVLFAGVVYANCTTSTVTYGGKMVTCTTCCNGPNNCHTQCF